MSYGGISNFIVLGDSVFEMQAALILGKQFSKAFIKTIKFRPSPKMEEIIRQIVFAFKAFDSICAQQKSMEVILVRNQEFEQAK